MAAMTSSGKHKINKITMIRRIPVTRRATKTLTTATKLHSFITTISYLLVGRPSTARTRRFFSSAGASSRMAARMSTTTWALDAVAGPMSMPHHVRTATSADSGFEAVRGWTCRVDGQASSRSTWTSSGGSSFDWDAGSGRPRIRRRRIGPVTGGGLGRVRGQPLRLDGCPGRRYSL